MVGIALHGGCLLGCQWFSSVPSCGQSQIMTGVKSASTAHKTIHTFVFEAVVTVTNNNYLVGTLLCYGTLFPLVTHRVTGSQLRSHHTVAPDLLSPG